MLIRVDPVILKQNSGSVSGIGSSLNNAGQVASGTAQGAPSYDGQFGPHVQAIGHEALARAQGLFNQMNNLSSQLQSKAQAFEAADMAGIASFESSVNDIQILSPWLGLTGIPLDVLERYLKLGILFGDPGLALGLIISIIVGPQLATKTLSPSPQPTQVEQGKTWSETEIKNQIVDSQGGLPLDNGQEQCVDWARKRRETLGATKLPAIGIYSLNDLGAHNYINIFKDSIIHINASDVSDPGLNISGLQTGAAIVWDKSKGYPDGHIAIVEAIQPDGVWVSQANWPGKPVMFIPKAKLSGLYVIPPNATL